jgi:hypothetical protein
MATFYGFEPADWLDDYFSVECRFRAPPNDDLLRRLGSAAGNFRPGEIGFRFSGPFAVVDVFPHPHRERGALAALADLLIDEAASELEEAVVLNSIQEPEGERPTAPGPALPGSTRALDPGLPEPVASPVFEAAMAAVLAEQKRELLREFLDSAAKQPVRLREIAPGEPPAAPAIPEILRSEQWHRSSAGTGMYRAQGTPGRIAGVSWPDGLALTGMIAVRDDRALLAARTQPRRLLQDRGPTELLLLEGKAVRHVFRLPDYDRGIVSFAWLDDDHAVVGSHKRTVVVALRGGEERATTTGGGMVTGIAGGRAIASRSGKGLRLFAWAGDRPPMASTTRSPKLCPRSLPPGRSLPLDARRSRCWCRCPTRRLRPTRASRPSPKPKWRRLRAPTSTCAPSAHTSSNKRFGSATFSWASAGMASRCSEATSLLA